MAESSWSEPVVDWTGGVLGWADQTKGALPMGASGRQQRTADITGYRASGTAPVGDVLDEVEASDQYGLEILSDGSVVLGDNVSGEAVRTFTGPDALMNATSVVAQWNSYGRPEARVVEGDLVYIHTHSARRYEVLQVDGERALLAPAEWHDLRDPFWCAWDILHVIESRSGLTGSLQLPEVKVFNR